MPDPAAPSGTPAQTPVIPATPTPGAGDGSPSPAPATWAAGVPQKFVRETAEATLSELAKSYASLETKLGKPAGPAGAPAIPDAPAAAPVAVDDNSTFEDVIKAGAVDTTTITETWFRDGKLTDEQYTKIQESWKAARGGSITKADINRELKSQQQAVELQIQGAVSQAHSVAGGEDRFAELLQFASTLSPADKADLNKQLANPSTLVAATQRIMGLRASRGGLINADFTASTPNTAFTNSHEMRLAQKASRVSHGHWNQDPAFMARYNATSSDVKRAV